MTSPSILSRHSLTIHGREFTLDRFRTRFGSIEWFLTCERKGRTSVLAQGDRERVAGGIRRIARPHIDVDVEPLARGRRVESELARPGEDVIFSAPGTITGKSVGSFVEVDFGGLGKWLVSAFTLQDA